MVDQQGFEISCQEVWREVSNYIDGDVSQELRQRIEAHVQKCRRCFLLIDETSSMVRLVANGTSFDLPSGFSERLRQRLAQVQRPPGSRKQKIPFGITDEEIALGSHVIYFWENAGEFQRGVRFLEEGLASDDHCVAFGHDEAIANVLSVLGSRGFDIGSLLKQNRLEILRRELPVQETLKSIEQIFQAAGRRGVPAIRFLGNLGMGKEPLPGCGEDDVLELEARATGLARRLPCVIVCMYDVGTLPGRVILKGGFQAHPLAVCGHSLLGNSHYVSEEEFMDGLRRVQ
jgi:hypothetical protein